MTQLTLDRFIHPSSTFPAIMNLNGEQPMLDFHTMAGLVLYAACVNNNRDACQSTLATSAINAGRIDVKLLFDKCKTGDRAAIKEMISLIASGMETKI